MTAMRRVVNCSAQLAKGLFDEAAAWRAKGNERNALAVEMTARALLEREGIVATAEAATAEAEKRVAFSSDEDAQRVIDTADASVSAWRRLRQERNVRLVASDKTQLGDYTENGRLLVARQAVAWKTYRQKLRDLPAATVDPLNPAWPVPPNPADNI
jgi:hypothetical protein